MARVGVEVPDPIRFRGMVRVDARRWAGFGGIGGVWSSGGVKLDARGLGPGRRH